MEISQTPPPQPKKDCLSDANKFVFNNVRKEKPTTRGQADSLYKKYSNLSKENCGACTIVDKMENNCRNKT